MNDRVARSDRMEKLAAAVTGRESSLFDEAFNARKRDLHEVISGRRVLLTGGAGFIATQTLKAILPFEPSCVVVADTSENALAELVRELRSSDLVPSATIIEPRLLDITTLMVARMFDEVGTIDVALQFAAAKHVRSERDPVSLLRMLHVNIAGTAHVTHELMSRFPDARNFVVSTDKAADPSSLMGASKRLMEMAVLGHHPRSTSTRFANVAFSSGSLLESWITRMRHDQPLAVPADTWRYFVSPKEAGQICAVAAVAPRGSIVVPDESAVGAIELREALASVLAVDGLKAREIGPKEALFVGREGSRYPVIVTERDTAGEKREEKFLALGEHRNPWLRHLGLVRSENNPEPAEFAMSWIQKRIDNPKIAVSVQDVADCVADCLPQFAHVRGEHRLDDRL